MARRSVEPSAAFSNGFVATIGGAATRMIMAVVMGFALVRMIGKLVVAMTATKQRLAHADTGVAVPGLGRGDEIGSMAAAQRAENDAKMARAETLNRLTGAFEAKMQTVIGALSEAAGERAIGCCHPVVYRRADVASKYGGRNGLQAANGAEEVNRINSGASSVSVETGRAAERVSSVSGPLNQRSEERRPEIETLLAEVKSA